MARPQKQGMDYFPHDTDASNDEKVDALRMLHGNDGYAFYFILLERIYRTADFELDVSDAETIQILARKVEVTPEKFAEMLQTALKRGCFCAESYEKRRVLTSPGIKKRASGVVSKRQKMASTYQNRVSAAETPPETPVSAEFPSLEKESKEKNSINNMPVPDGSGEQEPDLPKVKTAPIKADYPDEFNAFWKKYGKPTGSKKDAYTQWKKLKPENKEKVMEVLSDYLRHQPEARFRKDADRFLKSNPWESDFTPQQTINGQVKNMVY